MVLFRVSKVDVTVTNEAQIPGSSVACFLSLRGLVGLSGRLKQTG